MADTPNDRGPAPGYADLTGLTIATRRDFAQLTAIFAEDIPAQLADGEVIGVGIDIYRSSLNESDYQIFLDGGATGWHAFLQTPRGFTRFPGSFVITDNKLLVTLPWSMLGGHKDGSVSAFADWSSGTHPRQTSRDRLPELGTTAFHSA